MTTSINTNISAMAAQNSLRRTSLSQDTAMERLSTGIRINNAKDDAAGLAISTRMTANIRGISGAIRNANDGISLTQTAEGSLVAIGDNLQRIRELAVQSANAGNSASDRAALNAEAKQLVSEIDRVASNTAFNGIKLLDGGFQNQQLQVGAGNDVNDRIEISIGSAKSNSLGVGSKSSYKTETSANAVTSTALTDGSLTINGFNVGKTTADGVSSSSADASAIAKAAAINAISGSTGVSAKITNASVEIAATGEGTAFSLTINGVQISGDPAATTAGGANTIAAAINAVSNLTGVTAKLGTKEGTTAGGYTLTAIDGRNITIGVGVGANGTAGQGTAGASGLTTGTSYGKIQLVSSNKGGIEVGGDSTAIGATATTYASEISAGAGVSSLDLSTVEGSQNALTVLDSAINTITDSRASMGAYQNRLLASISNLETTSMNLSASRSRILDTDYAKETTNLAKSQIITQAATAMLAQANQGAQSVLALLK
jgi:flagellin